MNYDTSDNEPKKSFTFLADEEKADEAIDHPVKTVTYASTPEAEAAKAKLLESLGAKS